MHSQKIDSVTHQTVICHLFGWISNKCSYCKAFQFTVNFRAVCWLGNFGSLNAHILKLSKSERHWLGAFAQYVNRIKAFSHSVFPSPTLRVWKSHFFSCTYLPRNLTIAKTELSEIHKHSQPGMEFDDNIYINQMYHTRIIKLSSDVI